MQSEESKGGEETNLWALDSPNNQMWELDSPNNQIEESIGGEETNCEHSTHQTIKLKNQKREKKPNCEHSTHQTTKCEN